MHTFASDLHANMWIEPLAVVMYSFAVESMIRGYHEYKRIWENPSEDVELVCEREIGNAHDTHAVAIQKDINGEIRIVGHIPKKYLPFVLFLLDVVVQLLQGKWTSMIFVWPGGLEVPCGLTFITREEKEWAKAKKLIQSTLGIEVVRENKEEIVGDAADWAWPLQTAVAPASISLVEIDSVVNLTESSHKVEQSPPRKKQKNSVKRLS